MNPLFAEKNNEIARLREKSTALTQRLEKGWHYLMAVPPVEITVEEALEAFGFERNGL